MSKPAEGWDGSSSDELDPAVKGSDSSAGSSVASADSGTNSNPPPPPEPESSIPPPPPGEELPLGAPPLPDGVKGVKISGTVLYDGYQGGMIQIDVSDKAMEGGHNQGQRPKIVRLFRMDKPGPFEMDVPENQGRIWISAYNDADKNGRPSREEPRGNAKGNPYEVGSSPVTGIEIYLAKERIPPPPTQ